MKLSYGNSCACSFWSVLPALIISSCIINNSDAQILPTNGFDSGGLFFISPTFSSTETWTSNISPGDSVGKSGWISEISPGINIRSGSGRIKGYLNYSLNLLNYSGGQGKNSLQKSLNSSINMEIIDGHGFIDATGVITQQTISAFSVQTNNNNLNSNKTEVSSYSLSPYYRGRLSNIFTYEARYGLTTTQVKNADKFSSNENSTSLNLNGDEIFGKLSSTLAINRQVLSRQNAADTEVDKINLSLSYPIINQLIFSVSGGREIQNYTSIEKLSSWTSGMGLNWSISEVTKLSANLENNPLGKMHSLNFEHRTPRTSWTVSDTKSVSLSNSRSSTSSGNNYDLLYAQFSSIEADPIKRAQLVNNYLQTNGISANSTSINGYLTSGTSLQRSQNITFAVLGIRDTLTFTAARSVGNSVGTPIVATDDFNNSNSIRQNGFIFAYTHRLTESTVISNQFSVQKIYGNIESQNSELKSNNISASTRVGSKAYITLSARHSISSSSSFPYKETAITGNLTVQF
ncbi:MAG: TIGR03016 family PEP-CTERM system-associated outer membrane protein [Rhodoferax sp.]|uniref:TIGR03016 family PEP-CTERM system-associated outer membrane protein n=1 Tax=Rhodoferax sp. TaxID=50421 RepID=UPI0032635925